MKKLKFAILWHFHQPYYKKNEEFILPWVRLHGVKDYKDLPELLSEFVSIKQSINIVPSMLVQIDDYISQKTQDMVQILSRKAKAEFSPAEKKEFIRMFFLCNEERMIRPYRAYSALLDKSRTHSFDEFSEQEIIDIQVWYNLTWIGYFSKGTPFIHRLLSKESGFTIGERDALLFYQMEVLSMITSKMNILKSMGNLELSVSPFYHPILPLLCNTDSIREAMPDAKLPERQFAFPQDANEQIKMAIDYFQSKFLEAPNGMWPSEGSMSDESLKLQIANGIKWTASDEQVLKNSLGDEYKPYYKYFPIKYKAENGDISIFFRDNSLSDAIGFEYSNWHENDASNDFINRLMRIRNYIINELGEDALDSAVVPIILDGENCWEYYKDNGVPFLRALFSKLQHNEVLQSVLFSEVLTPSVAYTPELTSIVAGSWINANFYIWGGQEDHRIAWSLLSDTRKLVEEKKDSLAPETLEEVMRLIHISEGSDWFWWYGDTHWAENKYDFDVLFRHNLREIYTLLGENIPEELNTPINVALQKKKESTNSNAIDLNGDWLTSPLWANAEKLPQFAKLSSMHKVGELIKSVAHFSDNNNIYIKIELYNPINNNEIKLEVKQDNEIHLISIHKDSVSFSNNTTKINYLSDDINYAVAIPIISNTYDIIINLYS